MKLWMDVMRDLESVMADHERLFDAWGEGGVDGLVVGPLLFDAHDLAYGTRGVAKAQPPVVTFDPEPRIYQALGVAPPAPPEEQHPDKRRQLEAMLTAAKERGLSVWIFTPAVGMGPGGGHWADEATITAYAARTADTLEHYPMVDGGIFDGPEWGYEIAPHHMDHRSDFFRDLPEPVRPVCARLGYDYDRLVAAKDRLEETFHHLDRRRLAVHGGGGFVGACQLFEPDVTAWLRFRTEVLTSFVAGVRQAVDAATSRRFGLGMGPRSACVAPLAGYDFVALAEHLDLLLPKHYIWQRGFDGLYGTVYRYVETLTHWNPGLTDAEALLVVRALFGLELPGVRGRAELDAAFPDEFFDTVMAEETRRPLAAVDDPERVVPWLESGRRPHDGDPVGAGDLDRLLGAAEAAGLRRFLYHHCGNLTPAEWTVISRRCGRAWHTLESGYQPPDRPVL